jgi:hypothetical protein
MRALRHVSFLFVMYVCMYVVNARGKIVSCEPLKEK